MSAETVPAEKEAIPEGQADGSPSQEGLEQASTEQATEEQETVSSSDYERLQAELAAQREEAAAFRERLEVIDRDPVASKHARAALLGRPAEESEDRITALAQEKFGKLDENGAWAKALADFGKTVREDTLAEVEARIGPRLQGLDRTLSGTKFERALVELGMDSETLASPETKAFLREQVKGDSTFRTLQEKAPETAAELFIARMGSRAERRSSGKAERARLALQKGGRLQGTGQRGSPGAGETAQVKRFDPRRAQKLTDLVFKQGIDPKNIDFV